MENIYEQWETLQQFLNLLEQHMGKNCEIVLHDLTKEYGNTIADIRNGYISGRKKGDSGGNWGIEVVSGKVQDGDRYNVILHSKDGKIFRSSTTFFKNSQGNPVGSICVNMDITAAVRYEEYLKEYNMCDFEEANNKPASSLFTDVNQLLTEMIDGAVAFIGKDVSEMTRDEKVNIISYLDRKGAFLITKSGERVCEYLGISKYTLYSYLDAIRKKSE